jgi:cell division protein FtsI (penicillin-binding protein 3)
MTRSNTATTVRSVNFATSPLLASKTPPWRSRFVVLLVGLAFVVLLGRAVHLQIVATDFYQAKGDEKFLHKEVLPASRGRILDRDGRLLAASVSLPTVLVDTKVFDASPEQRRALAKILVMTPADLNARIEAGGTVVLRRQLEQATWQQVAALKIKGIAEQREFKRRYPEGEAAAHIVGMTNTDDAGVAGAELAFNTALLGQAGARTVVRDRLGRVIEDVGEARAPDNGNDVTLSIDSRIQSFAFDKLRETVREHGASAGSVVVLSTRTGEVLALANYPGFDPDNSSTRTGAKLRNIALTDTFEPGSTMKPFIAALALESGRWTPASMIETAPGHITITGATIRDSHVHGTLSLAQVIQKSSNVGTVKLAQQMPMRDMWGLYSDVGMGQKPKIDFPGVANGRLRPYKTWRPIEHATMSYGYGLSASLFQIARAYTAFARNGEVVPATLLKHDDALGETVAGQRVMSETTAREVREMLRMAASPGGTAPVAQERTLGYSVGGKTGTARMHAKGGYTTKHRGFFVGLAPISDPRVVVAVMIAEPSRGKFYGGDVAAPLFGQVTQQTLRLMNVTPDLDIKAQINAKPAVAETESY